MYRFCFSILSSVFSKVGTFLHCKLFSSGERPPNSCLDRFGVSIKMIITQWYCWHAGWLLVK